MVEPQVRKFAIVMCVMEHVLAIDTLMLVLRDTVTAVNQCLHFVRVLSHSC